MEKGIAVPPERRTAVQVIVGPALYWDKPGWGTFAQDVSHVFATREVASITGSSEMDVAGAATMTEAMYQTASSVLSGAALMPGCDGLELRYMAIPGIGGRARIRMFVTAKTWGRFPVVAETAVEAACAALPRGFDWGAPHDDVRTCDPTRNLTVLELRRHEEVTVPQWDYIPADFYYTINDDPGDGSGWPRFWSVLSQVSRPTSISLLFRGTELDWDERNALAGITSDLQVVATPHTDFDVLGQQVSYPADTNAALAVQNWTQRIAKLQRPVLARLAVRADAETGLLVAAALATAVAASSAAADSHPMYVEAPRSERDARQAAYGYDTLEILPWGGHPIWEADEAPHVLRRLPYLFGVGEAAGLAILPVPDAQGVPGFTRARYANVRRSATPDEAPGEAGLRLGRILHHGQPAERLVLPLAAVNRHVLVVGAPGSGKTTSVLTLLAELWRGYRVPFLVLNDLGAGPLDRDVSARLNQGEALIRWPERDEAELIRVTAAPGIDSSRRISGDDVAHRMLERARVTRSLLPYPLCTRAMCPAGCEPSVRAEGSRIAADVRPAAREVWQESNGTVRALGPIASMLARQTGGAHQIAYCAAAQLAAASDAFNVPRRVDIRPQLATAIREASDNAQ